MHVMQVFASDEVGIPVDVDQVKAQPYRCERRDTEDPHECSGQHPCMPVRFFNRVFPGLNQLFWSIKKHLSHRIKLIHDKKLMHSQVLKLVRCILKQMEEMKSSEIIQHFEKNTILNEAVKNGIVEIVVESLKCFPNLIGGVTDGKTIFHIAVEYRREKVLNHIYKLSLYDSILFLSDGNRNKILHFAGKLAPYDRLNSELENLLEPMWKERTNKDDKTALFTKEHKDLVAEAGTWMKDTSTSCMVVATLIVTVLFAVAFTVPGDNNNDNGKLVFLGTSLFTIFLIADMIGLFSSSTSMLMFLSIIISRYAEEDFLDSLPKKSIIGLATLFISIAALIVSFTLTLFIILQSKQSF
ncbi:hypothetical protein NE237_014305 [Protea cynaroides]|uniref:PGG domain-containing protein n=1 Tax=Protea cynaroides TaxID=273540 RepID=A0A9Q0JT49_9MAGN|nr:hypothetical protein NE237_014305 [Protea cynaroides]